jgi:hypothetical protein
LHLDAATQTRDRVSLVSPQGVASIRKGDKSMTETEMKELLAKTKTIIALLRAGCAEMSSGLKRQNYDMPYSRAHVLLVQAEQDLHTLNEKYALGSYE